MDVLHAASVGEAGCAARVQATDRAAVVGSVGRLATDGRVHRRREIPVALVEVEAQRRVGRFVSVAWRRVLLTAAKVVLAEHARGVTGCLEQLGHGDLRRMKLVRRDHRIGDRRHDAGSETMASGEHRRARGRALGRRPEVAEAHTLRGDLREHRHRGRLGGGVPVERRKRHLVDAEVVEHDHEDVRRGSRTARRGRRGGVRNSRARENRGARDDAGGPETTDGVH